MIDQILIALTIVFSSVIGESIAYLSFGKPINNFLILIEVIIYIIFLVIVTSLLNFNSFYQALLLLFFFSFSTAILVRGITTLFGKKGMKEEVSKGEREIILINLIRNLKRYKTKKEKIKDILISSGFNKSLVEKYLK